MLLNLNMCLQAGNDFPSQQLHFQSYQKKRRTRCEMFLKLTIQALERRRWRRSGVFIVQF